MKRLDFGILMLKRKNEEETKAGTYEYKVWYKDIPERRIKIIKHMMLSE